MAEFLDQDQINALLNDTMTEDESASPAEADASNEGSRKKGKFYRKPPSPPFRYPATYHSPLIRASQFAYNPDSEESQELERSGKTVVRSLDNYLRTVRGLTLSGDRVNTKQS